MGAVWCSWHGEKNHIGSMTPVIHLPHRRGKAKALPPVQAVLEAEAWGENFRDSEY